ERSSAGAKPAGSISAAASIPSGTRRSSVTRFALTRSCLATARSSAASPPFLTAATISPARAIVRASSTWPARATRRSSSFLPARELAFSIRSLLMASAPARPLRSCGHLRLLETPHPLADPPAEALARGGARHEARRHLGDDLQLGEAVRAQRLARLHDVEGEIAEREQRRQLDR